MKKLLLIITVFCFTFLNSIKGQTTIDSISNPIWACNGGSIDVTVFADTSSGLSPDSLQYIVLLVNPTTGLPQYHDSSIVTLDTSYTLSFNSGSGAQYIIYLVNQNYSGVFGNTGNPTTSTGFLDGDTIVIFEPPLFSIATWDVLSDNSCANICDGLLVAPLSGGTPPYYYTFTDPLGISSGLQLVSSLTTPNAYDFLCNGTNDLDFQDANGCSIDSSITVLGPLPLDITIDTTLYNGALISCIGADDGEITGHPSGGTPPFTFSIIDTTSATLVPDSVFSNLPPGTYEIYYKDFKGCIDTSDVITIFNPDTITGLISVTDTLECHFACDAEITVIIDSLNAGTPGTPANYTYRLLNTGALNSTGIFGGRCAGFDTVVVYDANLCSDTVSIEILQPDSITFTASALDYNGFGVSCNDSINGQITINSVLGGLPPYEFTIDGGGSYQSSNVFPNLSPGTYSVNVKDANDCVFSDTTIIINEPPAFLVTLSSSIIGLSGGVDVSCADTCDGIISVDTTAGVGIIDFHLDAFAVTQDTFWMNLCGEQTYGGEYYLTAVDDNGCVAQDTLGLVEPDPWVWIMDSTNDICSKSVGSARIEVISGGISSPTYLYSWTNSLSTDSVATLLDTNVYVVTVTDDNGCELVDSVYVGNESFTLFMQSFPECDALGNGKLIVTPDGISPYDITWTDSNGVSIQNTIDVSVSDTVFNLPIGMYHVSVVDDSTCLAEDSIEITTASSPLLVLDIPNSDTLVECFGDLSDSITVIASGGTGLNTYLYYIPGFSNNPSALNQFSGLPATITDSTPVWDTLSSPHQVVVVDFNQCTDTLEVNIHQPDLIRFAAAVKQQISCYGFSDGKVYVDALVGVSGGTGTYSYLWMDSVSQANGDTLSQGSLVTNLPSGDYWLQLTDDNGCLANPIADTVTLIDPPLLLDTIDIISHSHCTGLQALATGAVFVNVYGGTPAGYGYTYQWYQAGSILVNDTTPSLGTLLPDEYQLLIKDINGCELWDTVIIDPGVNPTLMPIITHVSCFDSADGHIQTAVDTALGGLAPFTFDLNSTGIFDTLGHIYTSLVPGYYNLKVVDSLGCTDEVTYEITQPDVFNVSTLMAFDVICYDSANGSINLTVQGGTPSFGYSLDTGLTYNFTGSSTAININNVDTGAYLVILTDTNGCVDTAGVVTIDQPDSLSFDTIGIVDVSCNGGSDGYAWVEVSGGSGNYTYSWSNGSINDSTTNDTAGVYTVTVTDDNGCSITTTITIGEPPVILLTLGSDSTTCKGGADGKAYISGVISGGYGGPYTWQWANGSITDTAFNLTAGLHDLTIHDSTCMYVQNIEVLEPAISIIIDSAIITSLTCHDANDGVVKILASSGQGTYSYSISDTAHGGSTAYPLQTPSFTFTSLPGGIFTLYVEDDLGCIATQIDTVINPDSIYIDTVYFNNVTCYGAYDGVVTGIDVVGGTLPYEYSVNGGVRHANMSYFNGYGPGFYTIEVFDANNCSAPFIILIEEPDELDVHTQRTNYNGYEIDCYGANSGGIGFDVSGGLTPYLYECINSLGNIVTSTSTDTIGNLIADSMYIFMITDGNGCVYQEYIRFKEPDSISHNFIATHVSCTGWNNGVLIDSVYGGVGNATTYQYIWNTGDVTYSIDSLVVGTYTITVEDENNCISTASFTINDNNALSISISSNIALTHDVSCWNVCDGLITVEVTGGAPNYDASGNPVYMYQWDDQLQQTTASAIGLCIDSLLNTNTYTCVVTDAQGCQDSISHVLNQPDELIVSALVDTEISCNGDSDGVLDASAIGGNGGNSFVWSNMNVGALNSNLSTGNYVVIVTDGKGCKDTTQIYLPEPSLLEDSIHITNLSCFEDASGVITATASGGSPIFPNFQYDYTFYEVVNGSNIQIANDQSTSSSAANLQSGTYFVIVEDDHGCQDTSSLYFISQPTNPLSINVDSTDETCDQKGTATAYVSGGTQPYSFTWNNGSTGSSNVFDTILELNPGIYTVNVIDNHGCEISSFTEVIGYRNIFLPNNLNQLDSTVCLGSSVSIDIEEMSDFIYTWTYNGDTIGADADIIVTPEVLKPLLNKYTLHIIDPSCPEAYTVEANIHVYQVEPLPNISPSPTSGPYTTIIRNQSITISAENSNCNAYMWTWDEDTIYEKELNDSPDKSTTYYVAVDSASCLGFDTLYVVVGTKPYDAITPNGDGYNDEWFILDIESYPNAIVQVFNRWGEIVFETQGGVGFTAWDGTNNGKDLPVGTYYYIIDLNNGEDPQTGPISIVR